MMPPVALRSVLVLAALGALFFALLMVAGCSSRNENWGQLSKGAGRQVEPEKYR